jgi:LPPG:FO 2-phospho-L-lactate transferase
MMRELGLAVSAETVFAHYGNLVDRFVVDEIDSPLAANSPRMRVAPTLMRNLEDRMALARAVLRIAEEARI